LGHLRQAKSWGDTLVVALASDASIDKGPGRPINTFMDRAALLLALDCVDQVVESYEASVIPIIKRFKPDIYVKGFDYAGSTDPTLQAVIEAVESYGGEFRTTNTELMSSSRMVNAVSDFGPKLDWLRDELSSGLILAWLNRAGEITFNTLGDPIVDKYIYVSPNQVSRKDGTISWTPTGRVSHSGGGYVIGNHVSEISWESKSWASTLMSEYQSDRQPAVNTRYVSPNGDKLFSVREPMLLPEDAHEKIIRHFRDLPEDVRENWIVADFGHGLFDPQLVETIVENAGWLALTVQANSTNLGFNTLSKWPRADYFVIDHEEVQLTTGDRTSMLSELLESEINRTGAKVGAVTKGHRGAIISDGHRFVDIPAFNPDPVDTVGAGDAFFSYSAPLARAGAPLEVIGFVGSVAAAVHVGRKGNTTVDLSTFKKWVNSILA
jgi:bifunctional ADP-heptose synthase (sugar kinase/adenylyltransferase)